MGELNEYSTEGLWVENEILFQKRYKFLDQHGRCVNINKGPCGLQVGG